MDGTVSPADLELLEMHLRETAESDRRASDYYRQWLKDNDAKVASAQRLVDSIASLRAGDPATLAALQARIVKLEAQLAEAKAVTPAPAARTPRGWQTTNRHYKGGEYRLLDALWRESDAALLLRYEHKDGMRFARPAREFLTRVQEGEKFQRRFMPMFGRALPVNVEGIAAFITLHEYMILANAALLAGGMPLAGVVQYRREQWKDFWQDGVAPEEAAASEIAEARAA